jgi:hypothetical protein
MSMRTIPLLGAIALLAACATPAERAAQMEREVEGMVQIYGPACTKLGYKADTDAWRDCVLNLSDQENTRRYSTRPMTTTCFGHRGFFHCSGF